MPPATRSLTGHATGPESKLLGWAISTSLSSYSYETLSQHFTGEDRIVGKRRRIARYTN